MKTNQPKTIYYNWKDKEDCAYFAFYTNQALNNASIILKNISEIIENKADKTNDDNQLFSNAQVINILGDNNNPIAQKSAINLLDSNLPFSVKSISDPFLIKKRLSYFLWILKNFRNEYAHYHERELDSRTTLDREEDFKKRENLNKRFSKYDFADELLKLKKSAVEQLEKRLKIDDKELESDSVYKSFKNRFLKCSSKQNFTEEDFIFFLSLFLNTRETMQLLNGIKGKKNATTEEFQWIRRVFTVFNAKRFQPKIKSDNPEEALILNIVNDLAKIPIHLKKYLTEEAKEKLIYTIQETEDVEGNIIEQKSEAVTKHDEMFSYRCLQYLELFGFTKKINFNINLGKVFIKKPYKKTIIHDEYDRFLDKEIHTFGKLKDFDDTYFDGYVERKETENGVVTTFTQPLKFYSPKYHFSNNRIGINIEKEIKKIILKNYDSEGNFFIINNSPDYFLSENAIAYFTYCMINFDEDKTLGVIKKFETNFKKFLKDVSIGKSIKVEEIEQNYSLKIGWIPSLIRDNLFQKHTTTFQEVVTKKINSLKEETEKLIENNNKKPEDRDKNFKFSFKKGDLATFVAKDIIYFMKPKEEIIKGKKVVSKLSSIEYDVLQSKLAFYGKHEEDLKTLFKKWNLYERHPFLKKVSMERTKRGFKIGIKKFFENYIYQRKYWLNDLELEINKESFHFVDDYKVSKNETQIKSYASNLLNHTIYLPNDLFSDLILKNSNFTVEKANINFLISKNLEYFGNQWFYNKENYQKGLDTYQSHLRDKQIRKAITFDRLYCNMLKINTQIPELSLIFEQNNLSAYNSEQTLLEKQIRMSSNFKLAKEDFRYLDFDKDFEIKIEGNRKIKDFGIFRHLIKDRRVPSILAFYAKYKNLGSINEEIIRNEILDFEDYKISILKRILEIDQKIYNFLISESIAISEKFSVNMDKLNLENQRLANKIIEIRNKLLHNKVPEINIENIKETFSETLFLEMEKSCNELERLI